eukprot:UN01252
MLHFFDTKKLSPSSPLAQNGGFEVQILSNFEFLQFLKSRGEELRELESNADDFATSYLRRIIFTFIIEKYGFSVFKRIFSHNKRKKNSLRYIALKLGA